MKRIVKKLEANNVDLSKVIINSSTRVECEDKATWKKVLKVLGWGGYSCAWGGGMVIKGYAGNDLVSNNID